MFFKMNDKNKQTKEADLIKIKAEVVQTNLQSSDAFIKFIADTLDSFAFRFFDEPSAVEVISINLLRVSALEKGIKEAIKIKNPELRAGIAELVKRVSKEQGPTIKREMRVQFNKATGNCQVEARISFGHPEHDFKKGTYVENISTFNFEDEIVFRNSLARHLESVCGLF